MKNTKKLLAAVMALSMVSAIAPMSAFAVDDTVIKQDSTTKSGTMTATYDVTAKYTVTIPAGVTLDSTNAVSKNIEANDVMLESGKKITVKLTGASNTASGASFSAKTTKGDSTATYTISKGETAVAVGDVVAEFTENGTQALTFSKAEGATYAGAHTETLTFTIAVEDAAPAQNVVDLSTLTADYEAQNGDVLTGVLGGDYQITVAEGATVTLRDANITLASQAEYAGINPVGDATILLEGTNIVKGGHRRMPGIYVPNNKTLTIDGTGSLEAYSGGDFSATSSSDSPASCGIGGKRNVSNGAAVAGGNLVINGGTITAYGGLGCAGIGSCANNGPVNVNFFGDITINGGTVTASGLDNAAGIGSGKETSCGNITITGGTVTATGDRYAAGIGGGWHSYCGDITIAGTVTQVTATAGEGAPNSIGAGKSGTCGTVTIGGDATTYAAGVTTSPFTYPTAP